MNVNEFQLKDQRKKAQDIMKSASQLTAQHEPRHNHNAYKGPKKVEDVDDSASPIPPLSCLLCLKHPKGNALYFSLRLAGAATLSWP